MLRQMEWEVQNEPITKDGVFPVTFFFFFLKTLFQNMNLFERVD